MDENPLHCMEHERSEVARNRTARARHEIGRIDRNATFAAG
jgi:hypothetical protein